MYSKRGYRLRKHGKGYGIQAYTLCMQVNTLSGILCNMFNKLNPMYLVNMGGSGDNYALWPVGNDCAVVEANHY